MIDKYAKTWHQDPTERFDANLRGEEEGEADLLRRLVMTGCSHVRVLLAKYLKSNAVDATDALGEAASWAYEFKPSVNADGQMLADLMHWYVVRQAMASWCMMQGRYNEAEAESAQAEELATSILDNVKRKEMPMKLGKAEPIPEDIIYIHYGTEG